MVVNQITLKRRNRVRRRFLIPLLVLSFYAAWAVIYFLWGMEFIYTGLAQRPTQEQQRLTSEIQKARLQLAGMPNVVAERDEQLARAQEMVAIEQGRIPSALNINGVVRSILEIAGWYQVKAIPLRTTPQGTKAFGQYAYSYWNISVSVEGTFDDIASFVESTDGKYLPTGTIVSVLLDQDRKQAGQGLPVQSENVTGTVELVIYAMPSEGVK